MTKSGSPQTKLPLSKMQTVVFRDKPPSREQVAEMIRRRDANLRVVMQNVRAGSNPNAQHDAAQLGGLKEMQPRRRTRNESPDQLIHRLRNAIRNTLGQDENSTGLQYDAGYSAGIKAALRAFDAARGQR